MRFDMETNKFKKGSYSQASINKHMSEEDCHEEMSPSENEREELLYIDVNLGDIVERIVVHSGDTAVDLASKFASDHSKNAYLNNRLN